MAPIGTPSPSGLDLGESPFYRLPFSLPIGRRLRQGAASASRIRNSASVKRQSRWSATRQKRRRASAASILSASDLRCGYIVSRIACSASPIVRYPQERADFFWRLAHLNRILIAGYADEGVSVLMRAERADVFNLNVAV